MIIHAGLIFFVCSEHNYFIRLDLRTDTGGLALICVFLNYSGTIVARILYYTSYERYFFCLSNDINHRKFR